MGNLFQQLTILKNPGSISATARIQKTGKLGFSLDAIKMLKLGDVKFISVAKLPGEKEKDNLYIVLHDSEKEGSFPVLKAGAYYHINGTSLFNEMNMNYDQESFAYHVKRIEGETNIFKLAKYVSRYKKRK